MWLWTQVTWIQILTLSPWILLLTLSLAQFPCFKMGLVRVPISQVCHQDYIMKKMARA